jgi:hypothetical protein
MSKRWVVRLATLVAASFLLANTGSAYYYYTYFNSTSAPYIPIVARFDLNTLNNNTVPFFVSSSGPSTIYPGDSMAAIISQMSAAAQVWNNVPTSSIRLAYGGFYNPGTTESAPGIQIEFSDDIPPGLLALSIPTVVGGFASAPSGTFLPIYLSIMQLPSDYSNATYFGGPSYSESFFVTLVHEFGHTLGLQHTLTSSVMSTLTTSASSKASPLGNDDIAGVSLLYPTSNYLSSVGSISGTVQMNGTGLNLASVVAISPSNQAVSTLTNPDGTYQINGIPPGEYYLYVHPLPPPTEGESNPDNVYLPRNATGAFLQPDLGFATEFYPGTLDYTQASVIKITPGSAYPAPINFNVNPASSPGVASVRTYSYVQSNYVSGAPILDGQTTTIAAGGSKSIGLLQADNSLTPGLSVGMLGSAAEINNLRAYPAPNPYIAVDAMPAFSASGQKHLLFSTPGNLYVLPAGFTVVDAPAPVISAMAPAGNGSGNLAIAGAYFTSSTRILFDGLPAVIQSQNNNILIVTPPAAPIGYTAAVAAFNSDGQSSLLLNPTAPIYTYAAGISAAVAANPSLTVTPSVIPSGAAVNVTVQGVNTNFVQGVTTVGFGTSDVLVNQVAVTDATHLTVTVSPAVSISSANITITTGLELISQSVGSQITATDLQ